ncbi:acyltransferase family protein [Jiulongibacter sp. NS-SX5]|uniref:acyltransferase family protein n=1 Tax=Jiulongibacter sp. NS-SX5 TaxID=3463854 RepID=UPI0040589E20
MTFSRENNFDLIRLVAAIQVMLFHGTTFFNLTNVDWGKDLQMTVYLMPGVPIFFTISGFLIYQSVERNRDKLKKYFVNRALRIYPALYVCLAFTIMLLLISGYIYWPLVFSKSFLGWLAAQLSVFQFLKIPAFDNWGVGHPNGSLWSISVEVQFYLILPLMALYLFKKDASLTKKNLMILGILILSVVYNIWLKNSYPETSKIGKLLSLFIMKYLYFFCVGVLIYLNFDKLKRFLVGKAWIWISVFIIYTVVFRNWLNLFENVYDVSFLGIVADLILSLATISAAYSMPKLSGRLLNGNDLSYGIYIYHMPVFNYFYHRQPNISIEKFIIICLGIIFIAFLSWRVVEKNVLKLKSKILT